MKYEHLLGRWSDELFNERLTMPSFHLNSRRHNKPNKTNQTKQNKKNLKMGKRNTYFDEHSTYPHRQCFLTNVEISLSS